MGSWRRGRGRRQGLVSDVAAEAGLRVLRSRPKEWPWFGWFNLSDTVTGGRSSECDEGLTCGTPDQPVMRRPQTAAEGERGLGLQPSQKSGGCNRSGQVDSDIYTHLQGKNGPIRGNCGSGLPWISMAHFWLTSLAAQLSPDRHQRCG